MLDSATAREIVDIGRDMFLRGLVSSHGGNISVRVASTVYITGKGSMTSRLSTSDIVEVDLRRENDPGILSASSEYIVHRAIYLNTGALAVVHAHPPYATLLSMSGEIVPVDSEGSYHLRRVPVVAPQNPIASAEAAHLVSEILKNNRAVMVRAHGSFAHGNTLEEAYMLTSALESSAFYVYHLETKRR